MFRLLILFYLCLFMSSPVWGIKAEVELLVDTDKLFWVSQKIKASLVIKTDAFAIQALQVNTRGNDDVIIITPESASYKSSEKEGDIQWQKTVYDYVIYPMRSGDIRLQPFKVQFSASMGYGQPQKNFNLETKPFTLSVQQPDAAQDDQFILSTKKLTLSVNYEPDVENLKVGDTIIRTVTMTAADVPDFLLQPVPEYHDSNEAETPSFKVYPDEPQLSETSSNNSQTATRIETHTFVAHHESAVTLAEISFPWFNPETLERQKETIPAKTITILPNPLLTDTNISSLSQEQSKSSEEEKTSLLWWLLSVPVLLIILYLSTILKKNIHPADMAFKQLERACTKKNHYQIYNSFYHWAGIALVDISPLNFKRIAQYYPELKHQLDILEQTLSKTLVDTGGQKTPNLDANEFFQQIKLIHHAVRLSNKIKKNRRYELNKSMNPC